MRRPTLLGLLLVGALAACGDPAPAPATPSLVGSWKTKSHLSQPGSAVFACRFWADRSFNMTWASPQTKLPPQTTKGTYAVEGNRIEITTDGTARPGVRSFTYTFTWEGEVLVLSEGANTWRLHRMDEGT